MSESASVLALDLGSSSGRAVLATLDDGVMGLRELGRFAHRAQTADVGGREQLCWQLDVLEAGCRDALAEALRVTDACLAGLGVDGWGVDHVLVDAHGQAVLPARSYRDRRMSGVVDRFFDSVVPRSRFWQATGTQPADILTAVQLYADLTADPGLADRVDHVEMLPAHLLRRLGAPAGTGRSMASTTGLAGAGTTGWSESVCRDAGIPLGWLGEPEPDLREVGVVPGTGVRVVGSGFHDTACAVHALPVTAGVPAFISCGSWSLVGLSTPEPVLATEALDGGLTNETRLDGGNRLLANLTGMWLLQECERQWAPNCPPTADLVREAVAAPSLGCVVDPCAETFMRPGGMVTKLAEECRRLHGVAPADRGQTVRLVLESLAMAHARTITLLERVSGLQVGDVHMVGGGSRSDVLARWTADACGHRVVTGPVEASAVGNALAQFEVLGIVDPDDRAAIVRRSFPITEFEPQPDPRWREMADGLDAA
ncbi:FGGY-family carbohydrate kinase [Cutibacterium avidum]|uniref:rhamnulokinase n=1 Tax=Cutibacterium avidum TaxID=33010 RepID=UPI001C33F098|nr:FGGY-family carbohydrate kinase [Cutibacterium avidum]BCQ02181.1 carbohydrate kinase [Cutibacterium avidum]